MVRQHRAILFALALLLALGIRVGLLQGRGAHGPPPATVGDEPDYQIRATNLALHGTYSRAATPPLLPDATRPPGFAALLAAVYRTGTLDPRRALAVVLFLNWATVALLILGSRRYAGPSTAVVAGLLLALDLNHAVSGAELLAESLCGFLVVAATALLLAGWRRQRPGYLVFASGLGWGLAALAHAIVLLAPVPLLIASFVQYRPAWRRGLAAGGLCLLGFATVTAPWAMRNYSIFGAPVVTIKAGEQLLLWYDAVVESDLRGISFEEAQVSLYQWVLPQLRQGDQWQAYNDAVMRREGLRLMRERPGATVAACARGFAAFFVAPNRQRIQRFLPTTGAWQLVWVSSALLWLGVIALAAFGVYVSRGRARSLVLLLGGVILSVAVLTGPLGYGRFRVSVDPLVCLLAAVGLKHAWHSVRRMAAQRSRRRDSSAAGTAFGCAGNPYPI